MGRGWRGEVAQGVKCKSALENAPGRLLTMATMAPDRFPNLVHIQEHSSPPNKRAYSWIHLRICGVDRNVRIMLVYALLHTVKRRAIPSGLHLCGEVIHKAAG